MSTCFGVNTRFGVEELPAEQRGCVPTRTHSCTVCPCRWHWDKAGAEVLQDAPGQMGWGCGVPVVTSLNGMCQGARWCRGPA